MMRKPLIHLAIALITLLLTGAAYGFWYNMVSQESAKASALLGNIATKGQDTTRIAAAKAALAALASSEDEVNRHFISTADVVPFLETLQSTGTSFGSKVEVVSVSAEQGKHSRLDLSLSITGTFDSVMRTLGAYEYAPYDISLTNLTLDTAEAPGKGARTWHAAASLSVGTSTSTPSRLSLPAATVRATTTATTTP